MNFQPKPYLREIRLNKESIPHASGYPFNIPAIKQFESIEFHPDVTFFVGENGSGKSTLVDALLTLLVPYQRRSYNLASGTEKTRERDERSYILGAWGKQKDLENNRSKPQYLRQHNAHSVLLAVFANTGSQQVVTLAQVLWIEDSVRKLFIVAPRPLSIDEHFRLRGAPAELRKQLKESGAEVYNEFSAYGRRFRQLMGFRSEKALDLFNQIVSIKEIGGLNAFVREHMLEKTDAQARIKQLRDNFENLTRAHDAIQMAEKQLAILEPLMQEAQKYEEQQRRIDEANRSADLLNVYIAGRRRVLAEQVIMQARQRLVSSQARDEVLKQDLARLHQQEIDLGVAINNDDVGQQMEHLRRDIDSLQQRRRDLEKQAASYDRLATQAGLVASSDEATFSLTRQRAEALQAESAKQLAQLQEERDGYMQQANQLKSACRELEEELTSLRQRSSHHEIFSAGHRYQVHVIFGTLQPAVRQVQGTGLNITVRDVHGRTHRLQTLDMQIDRARTNRTAAR